MNNKPHDFKPGDRVKINWGVATNVRDTGTISEVKDGYVGVMVDGYTYRNGDRHSFYSESIKQLSPLKESNSVSKLKPFNLQKALAGEPVVTRDGRPISEIHQFKTVQAFPVVAIIHGSFYTFTHSGKKLMERETNDDLSMAPEKKTVWVNIYKYSDMGLKAYVHESPEDADEGSRSHKTGEPSDDFIGTYPIEIEL